MYSSMIVLNLLRKVLVTVSTPWLLFASGRNAAPKVVCIEGLAIMHMLERPSLL